MSREISLLTRSLESRRVAIFCGAGISRNSGLPLADDIKRQIFKKMTQGVEVGDLARGYIPFEVLLGAISNSYDISEILEMFRACRPNSNHRLIANLARRGFVDTVVTTNFDSGIEAALEKAGVGYRLLYSEEQFAKLDSLRPDGLLLVKIHGTITDEAGKDARWSIRATLKQIADRRLSEARSRVIRQVFSRGRHEVVLVMGYSCSDTDLVPQIKELDGSLKEVLYVQHAGNDSPKAEDIRSLAPFENYRGTRLRCNTDDFVRELWASKRLGLAGYEEYRLDRHRPNWKFHVDAWFQGLVAKDRGASKEFLLALLLIGAVKPDRAVPHLRKAAKRFSEMEEPANRPALAQCYLHLGTTFATMAITHDGRSSAMAVRYLERALGVYTDLGDANGEMACLMHLSTTYRNSGKGDMALKIDREREALMRSGRISTYH